MHTRMGDSRLLFCPRDASHVYSKFGSACRNDPSLGHCPEVSSGCSVRNPFRPLQVSTAFQYACKPSRAPLYERGLTSGCWHCTAGCIIGAGATESFAQDVNNGISSTRLEASRIFLHRIAQVTLELCIVLLDSEKPCLQVGVVLSELVRLRLQRYHLLANRLQVRARVQQGVRAPQQQYGQQQAGEPGNHEDSQGQHRRLHSK